MEWFTEPVWLGNYIVARWVVLFILLGGAAALLTSRFVFEENCVGSGVTIATRKGEYQPTRRLTLDVSEAAGGFLDWLSQNYIFGVDAEDVAKFLLIEALEQYSSTDNIKRIKDFKKMIDNFTASRKR